MNRPEVVVREAQFAQGGLECVESCEQPLGGFRQQRFGETAACGQVLEHQIAGLRMLLGVHPKELAPEDAVFGQPLRVEASRLRCGPFDGGQRRGGQRQREQPLPAAPDDFGFGEACRAHQLRNAARFRRGTGVGERRERDVGRLERLYEGVQGRCHGHSVFTLMDPMLSIVMSCSAEAL